MENQDKTVYTVQEMLCLVCARPSMFTGTRNFRTAATFIDGFCFGRGGTEEHDFKQFELWLATECYQRFNLPRNYGWCFLVSQIYPNDEDAFKALPNLWLLYKDGATLKNVRKSSLLKEVVHPWAKDSVE